MPVWLVPILASMASAAVSQAAAPKYDTKQAGNSPFTPMQPIQTGQDQTKPLPSYEEQLRSLGFA